MSKRKTKTNKPRLWVDVVTRTPRYSVRIGHDKSPWCGGDTIATLFCVDDFGQPAKMFTPKQVLQLMAMWEFDRSLLMPPPGYPCLEVVFFE